MPSQPLGIHFLHRVLPVDVVDSRQTDNLPISDPDYRLRISAATSWVPSAEPSRRLSVDAPFESP
uniref:Uncharacterized protein n=1 Tax=Kalanchoe fedtschenkoi TaxID=63787 RepID=A0A7N0TIF4_KALFE